MTLARKRIELMTSTLLARRSNQLSLQACDCLALFLKDCLIHH
jgi:hypothetical protein